MSLTNVTRRSIIDVVGVLDTLSKLVTIKILKMNNCKRMSTAIKSRQNFFFGWGISPGSNFPGGHFPRGKLSGGIFRGAFFPREKKFSLRICSSVNALLGDLFHAPFIIVVYYQETSVNIYGIIYKVVQKLSLKITLLSIFHFITLSQIHRYLINRYFSTGFIEKNFSVLSRIWNKKETWKFSWPQIRNTNSYPNTDSIEHDSDFSNQIITDY